MLAGLLGAGLARKIFSLSHMLTPYGSQRLLVAGLGLPQWAWMPDPCNQPLMLVALYA